MPPPDMSDHARSIAHTLTRLAQAVDEVERAIHGVARPHLDRRLAHNAWSATEIVCHLRDVEELFQSRFHLILAVEEPKILVLGATSLDIAPWRIGGAIGHPLDPDRWADERQYRHNDPHDALAAFRRRRAEVLTLLEALEPGEWARVGIHLHLGRLPLSAWASRLADHDDNHLAQLRRAVDGLL